MSFRHYMEFQDQDKKNAILSNTKLDGTMQNWTVVTANSAIQQDWQFVNVINVNLSYF